MIEIDYNQAVSILRLTDDTNDREEYAQHLTGVRCAIQPLDDTFNEDNTGSFGKDRLMFCAVQDIKEGDRVIFDSVNYKVVALENFDDFRRQNQQMEILIREYTT